MTQIKPLFLLFVLLMTACAMPVVFEDEIDPTATPERPTEREALYESADLVADNLSVVINRVELLDAPEDPDVQILAVLTDGSGRTAYVLYPSNQPGVPEDDFSLEAYPLSINASSDRAGLWVLALRHTAYPVLGDDQIATIAAELAQGFDELYAPVMVTGSPVAEIVDGHQDTLLEWFGEIEVLGELSLPLSIEEPVDAKVVSSRDHGLRLTYTFGTDTIETSQVATPISTIAATEESTAEAAIATSEPTEPVIPTLEEPPYAGYRKVIDDDFEDSESSVEWFTIRAETYTVLYAGGAYAIDLTNMGEDEENDGVVSWGSLQRIYFNNYIVRAKMRFVQTDIEGSMGLWLNYRDAATFVAFEFDTNERYRIARFQNRYIDLVPWTAHPAVMPPGTSNEFIVRLENNTYTVSINGQPFPVVVDDPERALQSGRIAFYCYAEDVPATCLLEEIEVWIPENAPYPVTNPFPDATSTP